MCKHILNAQVSIRAPCCKLWFDCSECHAEVSEHALRKTYEMVFGCKKCKKVFRKDTKDFDETDEFCPHCDNKFVRPAKTRSSNLNQPKLSDLITNDKANEQPIDFRKDSSMLQDVRMKYSLEDQLKDFDYSDLLE